MIAVADKMCKHRLRVWECHDCAPPRKWEPAVPEPKPGETATALVMLMYAARRLEQPFTLSELVVAAWEFFPSAFGLTGFEAKYPSDHCVKYNLYGKRGAIARGLIQRAPGGLWQVRKH